MADCQKCELCKTRINIVPGYGTENPDYLIIGDSPGIEEDRKGKPFVGEQGELLRWMLSKAGIKKVRLDYIVHCRPVKTYTKYGVIHYNTRQPSLEEIEICSAGLYDEIKKLNPKVIIPLGNIAISYFTGKKQSHYTLQDALLNKYDWNGYPVIPSWHPETILKWDRTEYGNEYRKYLFAVEDFIDSLNYARAIVKDEIKEASLFVIETSEHFQMLVQQLKEAPIIASDIETSKEQEIIGISFSWEENTGVYLPLKIFDGFKLNDFWKNNDFILKVLSDLIKNRYKDIIWHNAKYDIRIIMEKWGVPIDICQDTSLMWGALTDTRLDGSVRRIGLGFLTRKFFPWWKDYKKAVTDRFTDPENIDYGKIPLEVIGPYGAMDSMITFKLYKLFLKMLKER